MHQTRIHGVRKHVDPASLFVIALTLVLFVAALVVKGFGHDLLLEAGVFLVSVKLIIMAYKSSAATEALSAELAEIRAALARLEARMPGKPG
jgi:hypothetical protein